MDLLVAGIEPATHCLEGNCSTDELYKLFAGTILCLFYVFDLVENFKRFIWHHFVV
jgi:hypothetical protein